ncbi:hypothetical protein BS78_03G025900 [Paspalum vaginatum]|nr:hypothetical protein BS78_03G025900 [Paspalum vaginatum]
MYLTRTHFGREDNYSKVLSDEATGLFAPSQPRSDLTLILLLVHRREHGAWSHGHGERSPHIFRFRQEPSAWVNSRRRQSPSATVHCRSEAVRQHRSSHLRVVGLFFSCASSWLIWQTREFFRFWFGCWNSFCSLRLWAALIPIPWR